MREKKYDIVTIGEDGPPWTSMSQASMAKVMNAILRTGAELTDSYVSDIKYAPRCAVLYSIKVESERLEEFKQLVGYKTGRHPNIQLGMDTFKSVKQVIYDVPDEQTAKEHQK